MRRVALALLGLPLLLLALLALALRILEQAPEPFTYNDLAGPGIAYVLLTYLIMGCISVPMLLLALWRNWSSLWHMLFIGAATGLFAATLPLWHVLIDERLHLHFRLHRALENYPFVVFGALAGELFWLLAIYRNPTFRQLPGTESAA